MHDMPVLVLVVDSDPDHSGTSWVSTLRKDLALLAPPCPSSSQYFISLELARLSIHLSCGHLTYNNIMHWLQLEDQVFALQEAL
jgi:hypothetical protein